MSNDGFYGALINKSMPCGRNLELGSKARTHPRCTMETDLSAMLVDYFENP